MDVLSEETTHTYLLSLISIQKKPYCFQYAYTIRQGPLARNGMLDYGADVTSLGYGVK